MTMLLLLFSLFLVEPSSDHLLPVEEALEAGEPERALQHLERLRAASPEAYDLNNLAYLEGVLLQRSGRSAEARAVFEKILEKESLLRDNLLIHLIESSEGQPLEARGGYFEDFLSSHRKHPKWTALALRYGQMLEEAEEFENAVSWYDRVWRTRGSLSRQGALHHALLHLKTGEPSETVNDLQRIIVKGERDDVAYRAAEELHRLQKVRSLDEVDARRRARVFLNNRRTRLAREYLQYAVESFPDSPYRDQYAYLWGRSFVMEGEFRKAIEAYGDAYRKHPRSRWGIYSKYMIANTALRLHDYAMAAQGYRYVIDHHPASKDVPNAYYNLIDTLRWLGDDRSAKLTALTALAKTHPREHKRFHYSLARLYLDEGEYRFSLHQLEKLDHFSSAELPSGVTREEVYYWKGRCLEELGQPEESRSAFEKAVEGSPNYYAYLSRERLPKRPNPSEAADQSAWAKKLLSRRPFFKTEEERHAFRSASSAEARIEELLFLCLYDEAALEIKQSGPSLFNGSQVDYLFNLAYFADKGGLPSESIHAAERLRQAAFRRPNPEAYPAAVSSLLYPRHYWHTVLHYSRLYRVEPELVLSVMHQESRFQSDAKSSAAARGLMQFIPSTARQLAQELGLPEPEESDLYRPELSVQLGAYYLKKLLDRFDGSLEKALAAYNSSVDNVRRWAAKTSSTSPPFFVANIGFRETKLYVLKVMGNYYAYRSIYGLSTASMQTLEANDR